MREGEGHLAFGGGGGGRGPRQVSPGSHFTMPPGYVVEKGLAS